MTKFLPLEHAKRRPDEAFRFVIKEKQVLNATNHVLNYFQLMQSIMESIAEKTGRRHETPGQTRNELSNNCECNEIKSVEQTKLLTVLSVDKVSRSMAEKAGRSHRIRVQAGNEFSNNCECNEIKSVEQAKLLTVLSVDKVFLIQW